MILPVCDCKALLVIMSVVVVEVVDVEIVVVDVCCFMVDDVVLGGC